METQNNDRTLNSLLDEYLSGSMSKASLSELSALVAASEANRRYVRERLELWYSSGAGGREVPLDLDAKYESLCQRVGAMRPSVERPTLRRRLVMVAAAAAAVLLVLLLPLAAYRYGQSSLQNKMGVIAMQTPSGSTMRLTLPDGTQVWLNAGSKIACSQGFALTNRQVKLTGEAYFDVAHNADLPFEINNSELNLKVLGTRFTYTAYPNEPVIKVDLLEGKVFLHNNIDGQGITLSPHERMVYDRTAHRMTCERIDTSMSAAWTTGRLFFDDTPLKEIVARLSRTYNVKVRVAERISGRRFYGSFDSSNTSIEDVLRMISTTNKVKYRYENGTYILY